MLRDSGAASAVRAQRRLEQQLALQGRQPRAQVTHRAHSGQGLPCHGPHPAPVFTPALAGGPQVSAPRAPARDRMRGPGRSAARGGLRPRGPGRRAARSPAPRAAGPLPIPLLFEERRQRAESLQVLDGRGHHDAGQPGGGRPGRRHLAACSSGRAGDDEGAGEAHGSRSRGSGSSAPADASAPRPPFAGGRPRTRPGWEEAGVARAGARAEVPPTGRGAGGSPVARRVRSRSWALQGAEGCDAHPAAGAGWPVSPHAPWELGRLPPACESPPARPVPST